ncbi:ShlB/FhaC/HecB family hemolysin secretion/activation protein [Gilvimarinus sp. DA14]|uniref:ShlB/FhaC/HecB family hemolysin secretion/activation protein n=1 Tax=Gilvimarinus sp. DA14 TaxID=2956798 RepID=UPI0020B72429|nr:ShlB/FhaC/HecB family hemolysin secretion/activation protein [Gilvimarinus sp. DA14]UTF59274.1 ShlB/FhaC/HecB family hemolysin secretion/activation protein [Gilvimarinus sp. DA14]
MVKHSSNVISVVCRVIRVLVVVGAATNAFANPLNDAIRNNEQRIKDDELRREDELQRNLPQSDIFLQQPAEQEPLFNQDSQQCFDIHAIEVSGVTRYSSAKIDELTAPFTNQCLGMAGLQKIVRAISNLYLNSGYVTSKAYVQPQGIRDGVLDILVVEGRLQSLQVKKGALTERQLYWAFPVADGELLNLRDLEQGLENINRLRQNTATMELLPGEQRGSTVVEVDNTQTRRLSGGAGVNNSGSEATGEYLANLFVSWDNPTGSSDNLYLTFSQSVDAPPDAESSSYALAYSMPLGNLLLRLNANQFDYQQKVSGAVVDFTTSGSSEGQSLGADYMLRRGQADKLALLLSFNRKVSRNYLEDVYLDTSSRVLYLTELGLKYTRYIQGAVARLEGVWTRSGDWLDAKTKVVSAEDDFQFDKFSVNANYSTGFSLQEVPFSYQSNLSLYYTPDDVIASEALSLGGQYTVRGIENASIVGYSGGYWRNQLGHQFELPVNASLNVSLALDVGNSDTPEFPEQGREWMAGAVISAALASRRLGINLTYAHSLQSPEYLNAQDYGFYASAQLYF